MNTNQLVRMSGQFWRLTLDGSDNIILVSTVLRLKAQMSFKAFTSAIIRGTITPCGNI